jgi:hypothetical protein
MQLDQEYLKLLVQKIESNPSPRPGLKSILASMGLDDLSDIFVVHYEILRDYGFIEGAEDKDNIGIGGTDEGIYWFDADIRLTAKGHEFSASVKQPEIWEVIKKNFKDASIETVFTVSKDLAVKFAKKKLEKILE